MPDDCGHLEARYINRLMRRKVNTDEFSERADAFISCIPKEEHWLPMKYTRVCPYCRTDPKKDTCVNCGAPQEIQYSKKTWDEFWKCTN